MKNQDCQLRLVLLDFLNVCDAEEAKESIYEFYSAWIGSECSNDQKERFHRSLDFQSIIEMLTSISLIQNSFYGKNEKAILLVKK